MGNREGGGRDVGRGTTRAHRMATAAPPPRAISRAFRPSASLAAGSARAASRHDTTSAEQGGGRRGRVDT